MEGETRVNPWLKNAQPINVLVVDDDTTCLAIVAAKLKKFQYQVVSVKHPNDALYTLRVKGVAFDLVVTDVHMPEMNGIQLQQVIAREFHLPVVLMSADKKEDVVLEGLENGAAFYISKPVSANDLKDLWQFAVTKKKKSDVVIEEIGSLTHEIIASSNKTGSLDEAGGTAPSMNDTAGSTSSVNEASPDHNKDPKRKSPRKAESSGKGKKMTVTASQKKYKVVWTNALHDRFLEAVTTIGLDRAVPKKILELMNVPYLTRENVASHLQKYRIFLRRVTAEANMKLRYYTDQTIPPEVRTLPRMIDSSFPNDFTGRHNPPPQSFFGAKNASFFLNQESYPTPRSFSGAQNASFVLNRESSSSDILRQSGFGQSRLLSNGGNQLIPNVARTSRAADNDSSRLVQMYQNISSVQGNTPGTLSTHFNPLVPAPKTGVNQQLPNYGISSPNFNSLSATTWKDTSTPMNYVGMNISNVQHLLNKSAGKQPACDGRIINVASELEFQSGTAGLNISNAQHLLNKSAGKQPACDGRINSLASVLEFQSSATARTGTGLGLNESAAIDVDEMDEDLLWDDALAAQSQMLMQSQVYKEMGNVENGPGEITYDCFSPMFDLDELSSLPPDPAYDFNPNNPTSTDPIVNLQNQDYEFFSDFGQALNVAPTDPIMNVQYQVQEYDDSLSFDQALNYDDALSFDQALNEASADPIVNFQNQVQDYDNISFFDQALNYAYSDPIVNVQNQTYGNASLSDQVFIQFEGDDLLDTLLGQYAEENHNLDGM